MPVYVYRCPICFDAIDVFRPVNERDTHPPKCSKGHDPVERTRILAPTSFVLKGPGWYRDLYSNAKGNTGE